MHKAMNQILIFSLILFGMIWMQGCKKEEKKCWDCGVNYNIPGLAPRYDTICDKTEDEINEWMKEQMQGTGNTLPVVWCDPLN